MDGAPDRILALLVPKVGDVVEIGGGSIDKDHPLHGRIGIVLDHHKAQIFDREDGRPMNAEGFQVLVGTSKLWYRPSQIRVI